MAVGISTLTTGSSTNATSATTASVAPTANNLLVLTVSSRTGITANPSQPTATGNGLTWVVTSSVVFDSTSSSRRRLTTLRALGASPTSGTIVIDFAAQTQTDIIWTLDQFSGVDTSGTNGSGAVVQSVSNSDESGLNTTLTVTLAAFANANNATYGSFSNTVTGSTVTVGSGFTQQDNLASGSNQRVTTEFKTTNDTTVDMTWSSAADQFGGIGLEIAAAATGIAFDAASNSTYQAAASSYSWSHTCTGSNGYLVVGVAMLSLAQTVTSITYNSVALSLLGVQSSVSGAARVELWGLVAPTTGSNTIAVTLSGSIASAAIASSYTGVHQTVPTEAFNSAQATNVGAADATVNVTTIADNDWTVDIVATDDTAITVGAGQTQRGNVTGVGGSGAMSSKGPKTPAGSVTMSWTDIGALATWSIGSVALRPLAASGLASNSSLLLMMGVG